MLEGFGYLQFLIQNLVLISNPTFDQESMVMIVLYHSGIIVPLIFSVRTSLSSIHTVKTQCSSSSGPLLE